MNSSNTNGTSVTYAYDANNRLQSVTDARTSGVTSYTYDATNQLDTMTYANGVVHDYSYDNRDRMTSLSVTKSGVLASYTQTFSDSGQKLTAAENSGRTATYGYDSIYRLLSEGITGDPVTANNGSLTYTLDAVGNRSTLASTLAALSAQSFTYDNNDRISGDTFDGNGNTLTSAGVTYTYDFEDRLLTASSGVANVYDGDGNRVSRTAGGVTTKFLVDEHNPTGWPQVAEETVAGAVTVQYSYGLMRVSQKRGATVSYYGYDAGGSTRQLYDSTGAVTDTYAYDAFGNTVAQTGSTVNPYQYRGEQYDASLQMYYLRARWYRPQVGRFLTEDTYEGDDEAPLSLNDYLYANADPVDGVDPSGFANTVENSMVSRLSLRSVFADFTTSMRGVTLGRVRGGAKLAYDTICCLDQTWSVLGLALDAIAMADPEFAPVAEEANAALQAIDDVCKMGCEGMARVGSKGVYTILIDSRVGKWAPAIKHALSQGGDRQGPWTYDPRNAASRRSTALGSSGIGPSSAYDRDEWPPAMYKSGQPGHARRMKRFPNRSFGSCLGKAMRGLNPGDLVSVAFR